MGKLVAATVLGGTLIGGSLGMKLAGEAYDILPERSQELTMRAADTVPVPFISSFVQIIERLNPDQARIVNLGNAARGMQVDPGSRGGSGEQHTLVPSTTSEAITPAAPRDADSVVPRLDLKDSSFVDTHYTLDKGQGPWTVVRKILEASPHPEITQGSRGERVIGMIAAGEMCDLGYTWGTTHEIPSGARGTVTADEIISGYNAAMDESMQLVTSLGCDSPYLQ